jgi:diguanylate cyclase (GGDEF)-like protein/PAS domain S-box-containing protein
MDTPLDDAGQLSMGAWAGLPDSDGDQAFDRSTRLAARLIGAPIALVALTDATRRLFGSAAGPRARSPALSEALGGLVMQTGHAIMVRDARTDPALRGSPAITERGAIALMGVPITDGQGRALGALCVIDGEPRTWTERELGILDEIATSVAAEVDVRLMAHRLLAQERYMRQIVDTAHDALIACDPGGRIVDFNHAAERLFGYSAAQAATMTAARLFPVTAGDAPPLPPLPPLPPQLTALADGGPGGAPAELSAVDAAGRQLVVEATARWVDSEHGPVLTALVRDISHRRRRDQALLDAQERARRERDYSEAIIAAMGEGYALTVDGRITSVNDALCELTGFTREELIGAELPAPFWRQDELADLLEVRSDVIAGNGGTFERRITRRDGSTFDAELTVRPARHPGGGHLGFVSTIRDVTERKRRETDLERLAGHDALTGLPNHRIFWETLVIEIVRARRHQEPLSVAIIDIDHFKGINDRHGHPMGDRVLQEAAARLRRMIREGQTLARVGGEEFAWILPGATETAAAAAVRRLIRAFASHPFSEVGTVTFSGGVSELAHGLDADALYAQADEALYHAKRTGRDRVCRFFNLPGRRQDQRAPFGSSG